MTLLKTAFTKVLEGKDAELTKEEIQVLDAHLADTHDKIRSTADFIASLEKDKQGYEHGNAPEYVEQYTDTEASLALGGLQLDSK